MCASDVLWCSTYVNLPYYFNIQHYKENTFLRRFLRNLPNKFITFLSITMVDSGGKRPEVFLKIFYRCTSKSQKLTSAPLKIMHQPLYKSRTKKNIYRYFTNLNAPVREHRIHLFNLYYTPTISIKKHSFYQMLIYAFNNYEPPGALSYDAPHGALLNTVHQQCCEAHARQSVNWCFTDLKAWMHEHRMHWLNFLLYTRHQYKKTQFLPNVNRCSKLLPTARCVVI